MVNARALGGGSALIAGHRAGWLVDLLLRGVPELIDRLTECASSRTDQ
jgi:hypothetical protein